MLVPRNHINGEVEVPFPCSYNLWQKIEEDHILTITTYTSQQVDIFHSLILFCLLYFCDCYHDNYSAPGHQRNLEKETKKRFIIEVSATTQPPSKSSDEA